MSSGLALFRILFVRLTSTVDNMSIINTMRKALDGETFIDASSLSQLSVFDSESCFSAQIHTTCLHRLKYMPEFHSQWVVFNLSQSAFSKALIKL